MAMSMFDRYGGFSTVRKVVSGFYDKVLDSDSLQKYFEAVDMRELIDHQTKFIASVMGGPASYTDDVLSRVHAPLNITQADFAEVADLLKETLEDFEFERTDIERVIGEVKKRESFIVSRDQ